MNDNSTITDTSTIRLNPSLHNSVNQYIPYMAFVIQGLDLCSSLDQTCIV